MFARLRVEIGERPNSVLIPERAVSELQGKNFVWVIDSDNKASQRTVKLGDSIGSNALILDGLKPGERVVLEGVQKLKAGMAVQPMTAAQLAEREQKTTAAPAVPKEGEEKENKE
jgi:membrane fusion protein (multidrug efflux system)